MITKWEREVLKQACLKERCKLDKIPNLQEAILKKEQWCGVTDKDLITIFDFLNNPFTSTFKYCFPWLLEEYQILHQTQNFTKMLFKLFLFLKQHPELVQWHEKQFMQELDAIRNVKKFNQKEKQYLIRRLHQVFNQTRFESVVAKERKFRSNYIQIIQMFLSANKLKTDSNIRCKFLEIFFPRVKKIRKWKFIRILGQGRFGLVLLIQHEKQRKAIKFLKSKKVSRLEIKRENDMMNFAAKHQLTTRIEKFGLKQSLYYIMQEHLDMTLGNYLWCIQNNPNIPVQDYLEQIWDKLKVLFDTMRKLQFTHGDMHLGNIMVQFNQNELMPSLFLIDFGYSISNIYFPWADLSQFLRTLHFSEYELKSWIIQFFRNHVESYLAKLYQESDKQFRMWRTISKKIRREVPEARSLSTIEQFFYENFDGKYEHDVITDIRNDLFFAKTNEAKNRILERLIK